MDQMQEEYERISREGSERLEEAPASPKKGNYIDDMEDIGEIERRIQLFSGILNSLPVVDNSTYRQRLDQIKWNKITPNGEFYAHEMLREVEACLYCTRTHRNLREMATDVRDHLETRKRNKTDLFVEEELEIVKEELKTKERELEKVKAEVKVTKDELKMIKEDLKDIKGKLVKKSAHKSRHAERDLSVKEPPTRASPKKKRKKELEASEASEEGFRREKKAKRMKKYYKEDSDQGEYSSAYIGKGMKTTSRKSLP